MVSMFSTERIAEHMPEVPVNIMDQYHPDNFCDPRSPKYDPRYAAIARQPRGDEFAAALDHARRTGVRFRTVTFEKASRRQFM
jgi:putative pyruvate formate lyase activating enzyme